MSEPAPEGVYTDSSHEVSSPIDRSSPHESSVSKEAEPGPGEEKQRQTGSAQHSSDQDGSGTAARETRPKRHAKARNKGHLSKHYRDLLNLQIEDIHRTGGTDSEFLPPSQIGASTWTSAEKETFFSALAIRGRDNLPAIASAVVTKSEPEVRRYLRSLQKDVRNYGTFLPSDVTTEDIPAAYEVENRCEDLLDSAADALALHVYRHEIDAEKQKYGDDWLISESTAEKIEKSFEQTAEDAGEDRPSGRNRVESGKAKNEDAAQSTNSPDSKYNTESHPDIPSAELLNPNSFLGLSRQLFMNGAVDRGFNWHKDGPLDNASHSPAIFRTAFDDFYSITVDATRRVVQASIFQAMSRIRARDESSPAANVVADDVTTAVELLGLNMERKKFWTTAARRNNVDVYSDSKRYRYTRPEGNQGVKLTFEEVEAELGLDDVGLQRLASSPESSDSEDGSEGDEKETNSKSDLNGDGSNAAPDREDEYEEEDAYLNTIDRNASRIEEHRLLELLGHESVPPVDETVAKPTKKKARRLEQGDSGTEWRKRARYAAEWERQ